MTRKIQLYLHKSRGGAREKKSNKKQIVEPKNKRNKTQQ